MKRPVSVLAAVVVCLGVVGCVGDTDPASNVTNVSATLKAHGRTTTDRRPGGGSTTACAPSSATATDTEVCGNPPEADRRCGPGGLGDQRSHSARASPGSRPTRPTTSAPAARTPSEAPTCGRILSFKTLAGTSYAYDRQWGSHGTGDGQFDFYLLSDIATDARGNVYVADPGNARIQKFSSTGAYLDQWGSYGTANGQFRSPTGVATDPAGNVYVADTENHRIQKFTSTGDYIAKWGALGGGNGQFSGPSDVATDSAGNVYVADPGNGRIQKFSSAGAYLTQWGTRGAQSVATDAAGNVYALDGAFAGTYVQKFSSTGTWITQWGSFGRALGEFFAPTDITTDSAGDVYVADTFNYRIQKFGSTGTYAFGTSGSGNGQFGATGGVAVDPTGSVYGVDLGNHRIQKFKPVQ